MSRQPSHKERKRRAYRACLAMLDATREIQRRLRKFLDAVQLSIMEFRVLELLYLKRAMYMPDVAAECRLERQNLQVIVDRLIREGWLRREQTRYEPAPMRASAIPKAMRGKPRQGMRVGVVGLTPEGKRRMDRAVRQQMRIIAAEMRAIDGVQQETLIRICERLRLGDIEKWAREIRRDYGLTHVRHRDDDYKNNMGK